VIGRIGIMSTGLFFGLTTVDLFNVVPRHPLPNQKIKTEHQAISAGGPAANAAVTFKAFGNNARLCSGLGTHPVAALAAIDLHEHHVTLIDATLDPEDLPVLSSILIDSSTGDRCVVYSDPGRKRLHGEIDYHNLLNGCEVVLFDGFYLDQALVAARTARDRGITTVLDGGSWKKGLENLLPFIDYAVCSSDFYPPGCSTTEEVFSYLNDTGAAHCAISRGRDTMVALVDGAPTDIPVPEVKAVDTLGAGDILHGAFCHFIVTHPFVQSLRMSAETASHSCRYHGTREWIHHL